LKLQGANKQGTDAENKVKTLNAGPNLTRDKTSGSEVVLEEEDE